MESLPELLPELWREILLRTNSVSLQTCCVLVCRDWNKLLDSIPFWKQHFELLGIHMHPKLIEVFEFRPNIGYFTRYLRHSRGSNSTVFINPMFEWSKSIGFPIIWFSELYGSRPSSFGKLLHRTIFLSSYYDSKIMKFGFDRKTLILFEIPTSCLKKTECLLLRASSIKELSINNGVFSSHTAVASYFVYKYGRYANTAEDPEPYFVLKCQQDIRSDLEYINSSIREYIIWIRQQIGIENKNMLYYLKIYFGEFLKQLSEMKDDDLFLKSDNKRKRL
jgi:hypothetical protein